MVALGVVLLEMLFICFVRFISSYNNSHKGRPQKVGGNLLEFADCGAKK